MRTYFESNGAEHKVKEYLFITEWDYPDSIVGVHHELKTADEILDFMDLCSSGCIDGVLWYGAYDIEGYDNPKDYKEIELLNAWHDFDRPLYMCGKIGDKVEFEGWATDC